jgi:hypothetical protein
VGVGGGGGREGGKDFIIWHFFATFNHFPNKYFLWLLFWATRVKDFRNRLGFDTSKKLVFKK